jgi:2-polyprenyl-6-methoxyphenol hydroxylase-like FAD-dependent oxidoreductase
VRALVIGAGIGGLTAALALHARGIEVLVFESVTDIRPLGVGINLLPHGTRELIELGLARPLAASGIETRALKYLTRYGQEIMEDPRGHAAGFRSPRYSIHRGTLQMILLDAARQRLGADAILTGHHLDGFEQDGEGVTATFARVSDELRRRYRGDLLIGADGIQSTVRARLYPREGPPRYSGKMMWRGIVESEPFLDGRTMIIAGHWDQEAVVYPISRETARRGRSLINWEALLRMDAGSPRRGDWSHEGRLEDFLPHFAGWKFGFVDLPALFRSTERILEYPMVDRDPVEGWSFGRVTLLGDAAHPMYPVGSNGESQAILDAQALAAAVAEADGDIVWALLRYEAERLPATAAVVRSNRRFGPERVLQMVEERIRGPEDDIASVVTRKELDEITRGYRRIAGFDVEILNRKADETRERVGELAHGEARA